jgi:hypothetical protein
MQHAMAIGKQMEDAWISDAYIPRVLTGRQLQPSQLKAEEYCNFWENGSKASAGQSVF